MSHGVRGDNESDESFDKRLRDALSNNSVGYSEFVPVSTYTPQGEGASSSTASSPVVLPLSPATGADVIQHPQVPSPETPSDLDEPLPPINADADERKKYAKHPPEFWEAIAVEYLATDVPQVDLAEKYGVSCPLLRYHLRHVIEARRIASAAGMTTIKREAYLRGLSEEAEDNGRSVAAKAKEWTDTALKRCDALARKVDELTEDNVDAASLNSTAGAWEKVDRVARRTLGLTEKIAVGGHVEHSHFHLVKAARQVLSERDARGEPPPDLDAEFTLVEEV